MRLRLRRYAGEEALSDLIERDGEAVLDESFSYLVTRLTWRAADAARRARRHVTIDQVTESRSALRFDPADRIAEHLDLMRALAALDARDARLLWWAADGHSGREQVELWAEAGFEPQDVNEAYLRKRISLARSRLRNELAVTED